MEDLKESLILHYLQGDISEDGMRALNIWLNEQPENRQLLFRMKDLYDMRKGGLRPDDREIEQSWHRLAGKMKSSGNQEPVRNQKWQAGLYRYAAVAVIFVCLTLGVRMLFQKDRPVTYSELDVESGPRMSRLSLPDGSRVVLNASTRFRFPDKFDGDIREVFLDGEAFFDVAHNARQPFVVHTDQQRITVLGTSFNVMDYSADDYAITTVISGSVKVQPADNGGRPVGEYVLKPNQQAHFDKPSSEITLTGVKIDLSRTWVNKVYHFRDEPLLKIAQRLEKIYGVKIAIATDSLKEVRYTGTFLTSQEIDEVLKIINFDKQFSYQIDGGNITVK
ncbi:MAG: DUF4974 domain-containing protein [Bacteroidales bacterium]|jgi:ferric-dicitrate binding protein FerR (iron transport regulator)|nr:DUF4974 domain-containing protein [Bacteroidales bacterium]